MGTAGLPDPQGRGDRIPRGITLAGCRFNDGAGAYVASQMVKAMLKRRIQVDGACDGIIHADAHDEFRQTGANTIHKLGSERSDFCELKSDSPAEDSNIRL